MSTDLNSSERAARNARAEASVWIVRLHSDDSDPQTEAGFRKWLDAHPQNAIQFEYMSDVWELGAGAAVQRVPRLRSWSSSSSWGRWAYAAAGLCTVILLGTMFFLRVPRYVTEHGEQRLVRLSDGSAVYLNSDSRLKVDFDSSARHLTLERGEGLFEVAKDSRRPFVVDAGPHHVRALGTTFVVRYEPLRTAVTLVEGRVDVSGESAGGPALIPGERLVWLEHSAPKVDTPRMDAVTAWRRGQVLLEGTALREAVAEMNRYDRRQLVLIDPKLAAVRVSGVYQTGDSLGFANAIAELHHFKVSEASTEILLGAQRAGGSLE